MKEKGKNIQKTLNRKQAPYVRIEISIYEEKG